MALRTSRRTFLAGCAVLAGSRTGQAGGRDEHADRRRELAERVGRGVIVLLGHSDDEGQSGFTGFRQESNFHYLTGCDIPGAALLIEAAGGGAPYRETLYRPRRDAYDRVWSGPLGDGTAGFGNVRDADDWGSGLRSALKRGRQLSSLRPHGLRANADSFASLRLARLEEGAGTTDIRDISAHLASMRSVKSAAEIAKIQAAVDATVAAHKATWSAVRPGATERAAAAEFVAGAFRAGCDRLSFPPIVACGKNALILHYTGRAATMESGELLLVDAGGERGRYAADIARTAPVAGRFSERQSVLYRAVLAAQQAVIEAARPGVRLDGPSPRSLESVAERTLRRTLPDGAPHRIPHAVGHHVGLDVHDPAPRGTALRAGMVLAIEPGVYLAEEACGIRVEDMIEITDQGCRVMSVDLPSSSEAIEAALSTG